MATSSTGVTPAANFIPTIWNTDSGDAVQANTVLCELVDTQFEKDMKMGGVLRIVDRSNPGVRIKSESTLATVANITETAQDITINRQAYVCFLIEDIAEIQAQAALRAQYTDAAGYSLVAFIEGDVTSGMASLPSSFSQSVGVLGSDPTDDNFLECVRLLNSADAPREGRFWYLSPGAHIAMLKTTRLTSADFVGEANAKRAVLEAKVGRAYGAPVYESSLVEANPSAANQSYSWFCHKRGVALVRQRLPKTTSQYTILEDGTTVLVNAIYQFAERLIAPKTLGGGTSVDTHNVALAGI